MANLLDANEGESGLDDSATEPTEGVEKPETINLVTTMTDDKALAFLKKLGKKVVDITEKDKESASGYYEMQAEHLKLFAGITAPMSYPADGGRAPNVPIMTSVVLRIWGRVLLAVIQPDGNNVLFSPTGKDDAQAAKLATQHQNWRLRAKHPDWVSALSSSIMQWTIGGSMFRYTGWDPLEDRLMIDWMSAADLIMPYAEKSTRPDMADVPHFARRLRKTRHEIEALGDIGWYENVDKLFPPRGDEEGEGGSADGAAANGEAYAKPEAEDRKESDEPIRDVVDDLQGVERPSDSAKAGDDGKYLFYEQHAWISLPGEDRETPVAVTVEVSTNRVVRLIERRDEDPIDRARFNAEMKANQLAFQAETQQYEQTMMGGMAPGGGLGGPVPPPAMPPPPGGPSLPGGVPMKPPKAPVLKQPAPVKMRTINSVVHYWFFQNPEGVYGLGIGCLAKGANEIANTLLAEMIIGERFRNIPMGFISKEAKIAKGDIQARPGYFKELDVPIDQMKDAVIPFQFAPGDPAAMLAAIQKLEDGVSSATSSSDLQSGEPGPSHETAASVKIRNAQGMVAITVAQANFFMSLTQEYKNYARLYSVNLPPIERFCVTEPDPSDPTKRMMVEKTIGREVYLENYDVTVVADPRMVSDPQRMDEAQGAYQLIAGDPVLQGMPALRLKAAKAILKALHMDELANEIPDQLPQPPPPTPMSPEDEDAGFLQEKDHPVLPDDNHAHHLSSMETADASEFGKKFTPTGKQMRDKHRQAHIGALYQQITARAKARVDQEEANGTGSGGQGDEGGLGGLARGGVQPPLS